MSEIATPQDKQDARRHLLLASPAIVIMILLGFIPLLIVVAYSFMAPGDYGGVVPKFSLEAYVSLIFQRDMFDDTLTFSSSYLEVYIRTAVFGVATTVFCVLIGFPTAYFMATRPAKQRNLWVLLLTIPFWSNLLVRTIAVMFIIRDEGLINTVLMHLGLIDRPITLLYTNFAILLGLVYSFLPFMVLPIYASLEKFDFRLVEAGFDLYASRFKVLTQIIIPLAKPGIVTGSILVFVPAFGAYVTPLLLGGGSHLMIGDLIALQFGSSRNWPLGSAFSIVLMVFVLLALLFQIRRSGQVKHG
ncbi:ABC transporter permease subunit [Rhizobium phaseoli]|uniref:ABC transporter permease subunit n=1 Tax=Rhizobium phaseoli TaxID=396 RepID=A0A7K3U8T1_9HYPH|nr:ABC transporter permease [Rhizobium phaseoli]NEJ69569.1 ABC transporter permease subunit [Rhizobium phaseoli]